MKRTLTLYTLGLPAAYFLTAFFSNFYPGILYFIFISLFFQLLCGIGSSLFLKDTLEKFKTSWRDDWVSLLVLVVVSTLSISAIAVSWQYPTLFDRRIISVDTNLLPLFMGLAILSTAGAIPLERFMERKGFIPFIRRSTFFQFIRSNLAGIFIAIFFFFTYFVFAQSLNFYGYNTLDQFFDTDASQWIARLTLHPDDDMPPIRAVHPMVMLILPSFGMVDIYYSERA